MNEPSFGNPFNSPLRPVEGGNSLPSVISSSIGSSLNPFDSPEGKMYEHESLVDKESIGDSLSVSNNVSEPSLDDIAASYSRSLLASSVGSEYLSNDVSHATSSNFPSGLNLGSNRRQASLEMQHFDTRRSLLEPRQSFVDKSSQSILSYDHTQPEYDLSNDIQESKQPSYRISQFCLTVIEAASSEVIIVILLLPVIVAVFAIFIGCQFDINGAHRVYSLSLRGNSFIDQSLGSHQLPYAFHDDLLEISLSPLMNQTMIYLDYFTVYVNISDMPQQIIHFGSDMLPLSNSLPSHLMTTIPSQELIEIASISSYNIRSIYSIYGRHVEPILYVKSPSISKMMSQQVHSESVMMTLTITSPNEAFSIFRYICQCFTLIILTSCGLFWGYLLSLQLRIARKKIEYRQATENANNHVDDPSNHPDELRVEHSTWSYVRGEFLFMFIVIIGLILWLDPIALIVIFIDSFYYPFNLKRSHMNLGISYDSVASIMLLIGYILSWIAFYGKSFFQSNNWPPVGALSHDFIAICRDFVWITLLSGQFEVCNNNFQWKYCVNSLAIGRIAERGYISQHQPQYSQRRFLWMEFIKFHCKTISTVCSIADMAFIVR